MSRIGKKPIEIPKTVLVSFGDQQKNKEKNSNEKKEVLTVKGKHGILEQLVETDLLSFCLEEQKLIITRKVETKRAREYHGLIRALLQNMVIGVNETFSKNLIAEGVGYKFGIEKDNLILTVGFSHVVNFSIPSDLNVKLESPTKLCITGINKERIGFFAAQIRAIRPPEPYKGKGILYEGEVIRRKVGKTGK